MISAIVFNWTIKFTKVAIEFESIFDFKPFWAISPLASSNFHWECPLIPSAFMVSRAVKDSMRTAFLRADAS